MLDYAANAVAHWPAERIRQLFLATCESRGVDPEEELVRLVGMRADFGEFWDRVKTNLYAGQIRLVFVADAIPLELRRIIEFLNEQVDPASVMGVEVARFVADGRQALMPRLIGVNARSEERKSAVSSRPRLTGPEALLDRFDAPEPRDSIQRLLQASERNGYVTFLGSVGCSIRARLPGWARPLSIAWLFPPSIPGWMGFRDLTLGYVTEPFEGNQEDRKALDHYVQAIGTLSGAHPIDRPWFKGFQVPLTDLSACMPRIIAALDSLSLSFAGRGA